MLILIRGLPGSGKSTLARKLAKLLDAKHFEADDYFTSANGIYTFDPSKLGEAHELCQRRTREALNAGQVVIVSNTFTTFREMKPYLAMRSHCDPAFRIIRCTGKFKSVHDVPLETIERMAERWQPIVVETTYNPNED